VDIAIIDRALDLLQLLYDELAALKYVYLDFIVLALVNIVLVVSAQQRRKLYLYSLDDFLNGPHLILLLHEDFSALFVEVAEGSVEQLDIEGEFEVERKRAQ
jgi:hypothetical protein